MNSEAFNPYDLRPLASLNRRVAIPLPGSDPDWAGKTGWELCSTPALARLVQSRASELGLESTPSDELPRRLNDLLDSADDRVRAAAWWVAETHGRRLGCLIASILLSPSRLSAPPSGWEEAYLGHWRAAVRHIVLGGGLVNGRLGELTAGAAEMALRACGIAGRSLRAASYPSFLPLIGAARSIAPGSGRCAAVADFGGSWAKRGLAFFGANGILEALRILPPVSIAAFTRPGKTSQLAAAITSILAETIQAAGAQADLSPHVVGSVAAYVVDGQPVPPGERAGPYSWLREISADLCGWISARIAETCGRPVRFHFAHDGDAAAASQAGQEQTAVVMLGSALGVGFVPLGDKLRRVAPNFRLENISSAAV